MYVFLPTLAGLLLFALQLLLAVTLLQGFPHLSRMCALNTILCILSMEMNVRIRIKNQKNTNRSCQPPPWPPPHRSPLRFPGAAPQWSRRSLLSSPTAPHSSRSQKSGSSETCKHKKTTQTKGENKQEDHEVKRCQTDSFKSFSSPFHSSELWSCPPPAGSQFRVSPESFVNHSFAIFFVNQSFAINILSSPIQSFLQYCHCFEVWDIVIYQTA